MPEILSNKIGKAVDFAFHSAEEHSSLFFAFFIFIGAIVLISYIRQMHTLRKLFNFWRTIRLMKKRETNNGRAKVDPQNCTMIGLNGRRPVYVPDNAKHVFVCGTTGSGKTVALSNFVQHGIH